MEDSACLKLPVDPLLQAMACNMQEGWRAHEEVLQHLAAAEQVSLVMDNILADAYMMAMEAIRISKDSDSDSEEQRRRLSRQMEGARRLIEERKAELEQLREKLNIADCKRDESLKQHRGYTRKMKDLLCIIGQPELEASCQRCSSQFSESQNAYSNGEVLETCDKICKPM
ncbi:hypothetical protein NDU88_008559 [Pleurodeles waltl]|uniref:Uncharacterized protein n=1 Tax=Pleurodeles waltl TaxID=8319 RepID=A0AAV7PUP2_PLEWA|nr:hypothetical protein NDU88_008559 [Pleurodeles waltl]